MLSSNKKFGDFRVNKGDVFWPSFSTLQSKWWGVEDIKRVSVHYLDLRLCAVAGWVVTKVKFASSLMGKVSHFLEF